MHLVYPPEFGITIRDLQHLVFHGKPQTENRKLQFAFTRLQFDVVGISNFSKASAVF